MELREVRRLNLQKLMDREFGAGARGAQSRLAQRVGKPQNYISRCLASPDKAGSKTIGEDVAREIEEAFGLDRYELDRPLPEMAAASTESLAPTETPFDSVAFKALQNLKGVVTPRSLAVIKRIEKAAIAGRLKETDLVLLEGIAARFEELNKDQS